MRTEQQLPGLYSGLFASPRGRGGAAPLYTHYGSEFYPRFWEQFSEAKIRQSQPGGFGPGSFLKIENKKNTFSKMK